MKGTMNNTNTQSERIGIMLSERGFNSLVSCYSKVDTIGAFIMKYVPLLLIIIRLIVSAYYYPRSIQYLIEHPLSELTYLLNSLGVYFYIAIGIFFGTAIIAYIIKRIIAVKASQIFYQVYYDLGIEAPKFEI